MIARSNPLCLVALAAASVVALLLGGTTSMAQPDAPFPEPSPASKAFAAGDCARCHAVPNEAASPRTESCAGCHIWMRKVSANPKARAKAMEHFPLWERYRAQNQTIEGG